ncbi:putative exosome complex component RRP41 [Astathelohania contejeani]|uniref:Exosome complex component RRP41 n=1 Tax=Astathelohania contejeani TaxID=164912 RepID=A0ABQ7I0G0_9MICR|nr:putative exosome complex component RRP41 [Thelohania contejeani]
MEIITNEGYRMDGRKKDEIRRIRLRSGVTEKTGHIELHHGNTKIRCAMGEYKERQKEKVSFQIFFYDGTSNDRLERKGEELQQTLSYIFNPLVISVESLELNLTVLQDDGSLLSCAINCVSITLCYNGIGMTDFVVGSTTGMYHHIPIVDINGHEETNRISQVVMAYLPHRETLTYYMAIGKIQKNRLKIATKEGINTCKKYFSIFSDFLKGGEIELDKEQSFCQIV